MSGAIATPHALATRAGLEAFEAGGNAIDAALAAAAVLTVVFPHQCAIGGDLFALVGQPDGKTFSVNGSGALATATDVDDYRSRFNEVPDYGPLSITVPGVLSGWQKIADLGGSLDLPALLAPAIQAAAHGAKVSRSLAAGIQWRRDVLLQDHGMAELFVPNGKPLVEGDLLQQPALHATLETLAAEGIESFYTGSIGEQLISALNGLGSALSLDDFAAHKTEITSALSIDYGDISLLTSPPNSQGFMLLESVAALAGAGIGLEASSENAASKLHALMLAAEDRDLYLGDPKSVTAPLETLLDEAVQATRLRQRLRQKQAPPEQHYSAAAHGDTVAICAMDSDGGAVSLIQSVYQTFGAGILEPETGIIMHNRARGFSLTAGAANELLPGTRPAHTLMPLLAYRDRKAIAAIGTMGGRAQPQILLQILAGALDLMKSLATTLTAPRWVFGSRDLGFNRPTIAIEGDADAQLNDLLQTDGFDISRVEPQNENMGHANVVRIGSGGNFEAAADPRSDGLALIHDE
jgi:gamma-glutamyltranspeptidase